MPGCGTGQGRARGGTRPPCACRGHGYRPGMKVSSRVMVAWAITVFLLIGAVFIAITLIRGDDTDMERQPVGVGAFADQVLPGPGA